MTIRDADIPKLFEGCLRKLRERKDELTALDGRFGDGDLGVNLDIGFTAVCRMFQERAPTDVADALTQAAAVLNREAPSTLGTLLSVGMMYAAQVAPQRHEIDLPLWRSMTEAGLRGVMETGGGHPGDRTLIDAWKPYADSLMGEETDAPLGDAMKRAVRMAWDGALLTGTMSAKVGRARMFAQQAIGTPDGGAVAFCAMMEGVLEATLA